MEIKDALLGAIIVYLWMRPRQVVPPKPEAEEEPSIEPEQKVRVHPPGFVSGYSKSPFGPPSIPSIPQAEGLLEERGGMVIIDP